MNLPGIPYSCVPPVVTFPLLALSCTVAAIYNCSAQQRASEMGESTVRGRAGARRTSETWVAAYGPSSSSCRVLAPVNVAGIRTWLDWEYGSAFMVSNVSTGNGVTSDVME